MARMLVIEDNQTNLDLMIYLLLAFGHTPSSATTGIAGLEIAQRETPDLIICDIQLPELDGYAVAQRLKADPALGSIPLIAVSALAMVGDRDQILAAGFDGYISKPIAPETFVAQVEAFLAPDQRRPAMPTVSETTATTVTHRPAATKSTILVVDDQPLNLELIRSICEPFGYIVQTASSVREALALLYTQPPDLILSDMHMPEQDGRELVRNVRANPNIQHIPIIIHSATVGSDFDRIEMLQLGATKFIDRPMEPQMILAEIEACLHSKPEH